jgi:phage terminase large subunit GpA-like protein
MQALEPDSGHQVIVLMKSAQVGGTEVGLNFLGWAMSQAQGPAMLVLPSRTAARSFSRKRITPMIDLSEDLSSKILSKSDRDKDNMLTEKRFQGASLVIAGCGSSNDLRSDPIRFVVLEEVSAYPEDVDGEGDPIELAWNRTKTFQETRKVFFVSTPANRRTCRITSQWELSDKRHFHVPCPHCGHFQALVWEQIRYSKEDTKNAEYECISCESLISHNFKTYMLERGEWIPSEPKKNIAGFHISALYSPIGIGDTWGHIADRYEKSRKDVLKLKAFYNNDLGLPWDDTEDSVEWELLFARRETYNNTYIPADIRLITMGVDVQKRYLAYEIVGWTRDKRSYSLEYEEISGDTADVAVWRELAKVMERSFKIADKVSLPIAKIGVDTGYRATTVYEFVRDQDHARVAAVDGRPGEANFIVGTASHVDVGFDGKRTSYGLKLYPVGTHLIKSELYSWLRLKPNEDGSLPSGYCHFPDHYGPEYFQQLTAEELRIANTKRGESYTWVKVRKRNEALDCRVYARAMAYLWGLDTTSDTYWDDLDRKIEKARSK